MPLIIELTLDKNRNNLNNVFQGIIINSEDKSVNKAAREILRNDMVEHKPRHLVHCYNLKELVQIVKLFNKQGYSLGITREIIPNKYDIGIVREIYLTKEKLEDKKTFEKKYRYYIFMNNKEACLALTYNPEISNLITVKKARILVGKDEVAHCQILQTITAQRDIEKEKEVKDVIGTYTVYNV